MWTVRAVMVSLAVAMVQSAIAAVPQTMRAAAIDKGGGPVVPRTEVAEQAHAGDGEQAPLVPRSASSPRLMRGVRVCPLTVQQIVLAKNHTWTTV